METNAPNSPPPPPKKRMHGALKFFLLALAGGLFTLICTPCIGGAAISATKNWSLKEQYDIALNFFIVTSLAFMLLSGIAALLKRWGLAGFLFGVCVMQAMAILAALFMRMYDVPQYMR